MHEYQKKYNIYSQNVNEFNDPESVLKWIEKQKALGIKPNECKGKMQFYYEEYERKLNDKLYIDFGSMILVATELLQKHPDIKKKYQSVYRYIIIDEFQDTSGKK